MIQSEKIDRYNDDFYLQFQAIDNQYITANTTMPFLNNTDWSISYFVKNDDTQLGVHLDFRNPSDLTKGIAVSFQTGNNGLQFKSGVVTHIFDNYGVNQKKNINHITLTYNKTTNNVKCYINTIYNGEVSGAFDFENISPLVLGRVNWSSGFVNGRLKGGLRDMLFNDKILTHQEIVYIYNTGIPNVSTYNNIQHYYPLNQIPYESGGNYFMSDVAGYYNPLATASDVQLIGWTADELGLGVGGLPASTTYRVWESKTNYIPTIEYNKGLNMLTSQSLTINGLTIGDKLVVNYDELGTSKQEIIDINAINYTYSNIADIKVRLITVLKDGFYANEKVYKTIFNNGILRSGIESSYTEVINAETNLASPFDDAGTLKFPDLSVNNIVIVANGWLDLTDLQNSIN